MEDLLRALIEQNDRLLNVLESIDDKLNAISDIHSTLESIESKVDSDPSLASDVMSIKFAVESMQQELQWHKDLSFAKQLIGAVENVTDAVQHLDR